MCPLALENRPENPVRNLYLHNLHLLYFNSLILLHNLLKQQNLLNSQQQQQHHSLIHTQLHFINLRQLKISEHIGVGFNFRKPCLGPNRRMPTAREDPYARPPDEEAEFSLSAIESKTSMSLRCPLVGSLKMDTSPLKITPKIFGRSKLDVFFDITLFHGELFSIHELFQPRISATCQFHYNSWTMSE